MSILARENELLTFDLAVVDFDVDLLGAKAVDTLSVAKEHDFEPVAVRVVVDEIGQFHVDGVALDGHVDRNLRLQVNHVTLQSLKLALSIAQVLQ